MIEITEVMRTLEVGLLMMRALKLKPGPGLTLWSPQMRLEVSSENKFKFN